MEASGAAGWDHSAAAWVANVDKGDPSRELLLDPAMLELCGDVAGLEVLDVGCGEGRFSRKLAAGGGIVTGVEPCKQLLSVAAERGGGSFVFGSAEALPFETSSFDLAVCYLVLIDVPDYRLAIREMARVLRPGGRLLVANILPFRSALPAPWVTDDEGNRLYIAVDDYFSERADHAAWSGISVTNFHRPAEAYFTAFIDAGLRLVAYREPRPSAEAIEKDPSFAFTLRVPFFDITMWQR